MAPNRQTMGIKHQILMVTLIPNLLLILVLAAYLVGTRVEELDKGFGQRGHDISQQVSTAVMPSLFAHRYDNLNLLIRETMELYPEVYSIHIKDQHGSEVAAVSSKVRDVSPDHLSKFDLAIAPATTTAELYRYSPEQALNISPGQPLKLGSVSVILDGSEKARKKWSIILNTLLLSLAGLTFSSLLAIFLSAKLAEPIERINRAMQRLREGDLKIRVGVNAKGEIGDLQQGFNEMASDIATANENMLMQVDQATRDLQASMEVLEIKNVELDLARKRALNVSRFKSEFLANMSHEIRTPMNGIIGFTNLLAKSNLDKTQSEYIKTIKASAANLLTIINDILDLSKLEAGKLKLETAPFSLRECIENAVSLLAPLAHEKQLELVSIVYNDLPDRLIGDQTRIAQILTNLVNNAIKFTSEGEIVLRTMLEKEDRSTVDLTISVSDTGVGVQPLEQEAIFSAFQQGENVSSVGGTGLGLSICKRLASAMGGDIALTSTPGQGSCFNVTLRLNKDNEFQSFDKPGFPFAGRRALLIDTHHASRMVVRNDLIDLGFQVEDREFSLDKSPPPDSLFDLFVIGLDGTSLNETSVIKHVQRMFRSQQVPSILLASCSNQENLDRLEITEADLVRGKPIKRTVLRECVNS
ncbi:MAG: ATP-binding protein, partial [bacterium]